MSFEVARVRRRDGREVTVVAVRTRVFVDVRLRDEALKRLREQFPDSPVVLIASTSAGLQAFSDAPHAAEWVESMRTAHLDWQRYPQPA